MDRSGVPEQTPTVLLLQEPHLDERIWRPIVDSLGAEAESLTTTPPVIADLFSDAAWAEHTVRWIAERWGRRRVDVVVGPGHAASAAILAGVRGLEAGSVLLIDPDGRSMLPRLTRDEVMAKFAEALEEPEAAERLERLFDRVDEDEMREFERTGRFTESGVDNLIDATMGAVHLDEESDPISLMKEMFAIRLRAALPGERFNMDPVVDVDFRELGAELGDALHIAVTERSTIDLLYSRESVRELYPEAVWHDLPGDRHIPGWWSHPGEYASLIRSVAAGA